MDINGGNEKKPIRDRIALLFFFTATALFIFGSGIAVAKKEIFPYTLLVRAKEGYIELRTQMLRFGDLSSKSSDELPFDYRRLDEPYPEPVRNTGQAYPGLNLVTSVADKLELSARIVDMNGREVHAWNVDWFRIWPDAAHLPEARVPKSKPGVAVHGAVVLANGDLVFNYSKLGLVRLDRDGNTVWRLPYLTHHSIEVDEKGNLWVSSQKYHGERDERFPNRVPPFYEETIMEITPEGQVVEEWSVDDLLRENGQEGLLYLGSLDNYSTQAKGDTLHLNDAEPFPATMAADFFTQGDVLVSLRNINTVFVFNRDSRKIKFICTGWFVRQHDPDFIDGNSFSVFDNNFIAPEMQGQKSRIVIVSARDRTSRIFFEGSPERPFYTDIGGKHQWLPNGNLLITESHLGRALEINQAGEIVWEYINYVDEGVVGTVYQVQRLPLEMQGLYGSE